MSFVNRAKAARQPRAYEELARSGNLKSGPVESNTRRTEACSWSGWRPMLGFISVILGALISQQAFAEQSWVPVEHAQIVDGLRPVRAATNGNSDGDRLFLYLGNRNESWLRFIPKIDAPVDASPAALGVQIDSRKYSLPREGTTFKGVTIPSFLVAPYYLVPGGLEWSLGTSNLTTGRGEKLKVLAHGRDLIMTYLSTGKPRTVRFMLGNEDVVYEALGLREDVASGAMQNVEDYRLFASHVSTTCQIGAVKVNYTECMKPYEACKTAHPVDSRQLTACVRATGFRLHWEEKQ